MSSAGDGMNTPVHMAHCNQGEYPRRCKYGQDDICPALVGMNTPENETTDCEHEWIDEHEQRFVRTGSVESDETRHVQMCWNCYALRWSAWVNTADHARATANDDALAAMKELRFGSGLTGGGAGDFCHALHRAYNHHGLFDDCMVEFCRFRRQWLKRADEAIEALSRITQSATPPPKRCTCAAVNDYGWQFIPMDAHAESCELRQSATPAEEVSRG